MTGTRYGLEFIHKSGERVETKTQSRFSGLDPTIEEILGEKLVEARFCDPILNRAKEI